jgi:hypothetical protein
MPATASGSPGHNLTPSLIPCCLLQQATSLHFMLAMSEIQLITKFTNGRHWRAMVLM